MTAYALTLRLLAVGVFGVSLVHIVFGVGSEPFLGSAVSAASQLDPNLDSQNRFYGAAFSLFGIVFWIASSDLERYRRLLELALLVFFLAGATRLISIVIIGWPTPVVIALTVIELLGPPAMFLWLRRLP